MKKSQHKRKPSWKNLMGEEAWMPRDVDPKYLQELEYRRSCDIVTTMDPKVVVSGSNETEEPMSSAPIAENFCNQLAKNAEACGFTDLRIVQRTILPYMNARVNVCISTTGRSGKTIGYLLPLIQRVHDDLNRIPHRNGCPRALIIVPSKEQGKGLFDTLRALTADMNINSALAVSQMGPGHYQVRDNADIIITTAYLFNKYVEQERYTLAGVKMFVVDVFDDLGWSNKEYLSAQCADQMFDFYYSMATNAQLVLVSSDSDSLTYPYWKTYFEKAEKMVMLKNKPQQRISPSNHVVVRVREKFMMDSVLETMRSFDEGPTMVIVCKKEADAKEFSEQLCKFLGTHNISAAYYNMHMPFSEREVLLQDFNVGKLQVLVVKYCLQLRSISAIGIRQVIHVGPPAFPDESDETSYHHSSSAVAFNPAARSVVLFNVDQDTHCGRRTYAITQLLRHCNVDVTWPPNYWPEWAMACEPNHPNQKEQWNHDDKAKADHLTDLVKSNFQTMQDRKLRALSRCRKEVPTSVPQGSLQNGNFSGDKDSGNQGIQRNSTTSNRNSYRDNRNEHQNYDSRPNSRQPQGADNRIRQQEGEFYPPQSSNRNQYEDERYDERRDAYFQEERPQPYDSRQDNRYHSEDVRCDQEWNNYSREMSPPSYREAPTPSYNEDRRPNNRYNNDQYARHDQPVNRGRHNYDNEMPNYRNNQGSGYSQEYYDDRYDQHQERPYNGNRREDYNAPRCEDYGNRMDYGSERSGRMDYGNDRREFDDGRYDQDYGRSRQEQYPPNCQEPQNHRQYRQQPSCQRMESDNHSQSSGYQQSRDLVFTLSNSRMGNGGQGRWDAREMEMNSPREYDDYYEDRNQRNSNISRQFDQMILQDQDYQDRQGGYNRGNHSGRQHENYRNENTNYQDNNRSNGNQRENNFNRNYQGSNGPRRSYRREEVPSNQHRRNNENKRYPQQSDFRGAPWQEHDDRTNYNNSRADEQREEKEDWSQRSYNDRNSSSRGNRFDRRQQDQKQDQNWQGPSRQNNQNRRNETGKRVNRFEEQDRIDRENREQRESQMKNQSWDNQNKGWEGDEKNEVAGRRRSKAEEPQDYGNDGWGEQEKESSGSVDEWATKETGEQDWGVSEDWGNEKSGGAENNQAGGASWHRRNQDQGRGNRRQEEREDASEEEFAVHPYFARNGGRPTIDETIANIERKRDLREAARLMGRDETPILGGESDEDDPISMW